MRRRSANSPRECSVARRQFNECTTTRATTPRCHLLLQYKMQTNTNTNTQQKYNTNTNYNTKCTTTRANTLRGASYSCNIKPPPPAAAWYCVWYSSSLLHSRTHMYTFPGQGWRQGLNIHFSRKGVQLLDLHGLDQLFVKPLVHSVARLTGPKLSQGGNGGERRNLTRLQTR